MTTPAGIIFTVALIPYVLTWFYIRQLVREVNTDATGPHVSMWWWLNGWRLHQRLFPTSRVRKRIIGCIALTVGLGLIAFGIEVRQALHHLASTSTLR
jgi:hypothetical protein